MGFAPKMARDPQRIDSVPLPPFSFIARSMILVVVDGAKRHGELVADLQGQASWLGVADVMRMRRGAAANHTGLSCNKAQMLP